MLVASLRSRRVVTGVRLILVSAFLFFIPYSRHYYLTTIHDELPPLVSLERPCSIPASGDVKQESLKLPAKSTHAPPLESSTFTCHSLPGAEDVLVVLKTGATELFTRLPEQLLSLSRCIPNFMVFSDLEQDIGDYHVSDALDEINDKYKNYHADFQFYKQLQKYQAEHQDLSELDPEQAWDLDKWKNIPMLHKAYQKQPNVKWYVFIDADTFLSWTNLLQLLGRLDPAEPLYFGSVVVSNHNTTFAHGGTGYVISNAAAKKFEKIRDPEHIAKWEFETSTDCCGDVMLALALSDAGVELTQAWPLTQGESPSTIKWSDRIWCTPAVTWHHMQSFEVEALWHFEQTWIKQTESHGQVGNLPHLSLPILLTIEPPQIPYLYKDAFEYFVQPYISAHRSDWDNLSLNRTFTDITDITWGHIVDEQDQFISDSISDGERQSTESAEACYAACEADEECLQYFFKPGSCSLDYVVRLGRVADVEDRTVSGWMLNRIEEFKQRQAPCVPAWDLDT